MDTNLKCRGIDVVIRLDVDKDESIRRADGRLFDPVTETYYHKIDNPAPVDVKGLAERLVNLNDDHHNPENIIKDCK